MIGAIVPYVSKIRRSYQSNDIIDRLNYQYTTMIVMLSAITLAATQYVGKPIQVQRWTSAIISWHIVGIIFRMSCSIMQNRLLTCLIVI